MHKLSKLIQLDQSATTLLLPCEGFAPDVAGAMPYRQAGDSLLLLFLLFVMWLFLLLLLLL